MNSNENNIPQNFNTQTAGETAIIRETPTPSDDPNYKVGPGNPPKHTRFSKTNQPNPEKQKETKRRKKFTREILAELMALRYDWDSTSQVKAQLEKAFGKKMIEKANVMEIATMMQLQRAVLKGDTNAFRELMVQVFGQPKQVAELTGANGADLFQQKSDAELHELLKQTLSKLNGTT